TVAPYSLRGRATPTVAVPRTWRELASPHLKQLDFREALRRVAKRGDPMSELTEAGAGRGAHPQRDRLEVYRSKRDPRATPEPVPEPGVGRGSSGGSRSRSSRTSKRAKDEGGADADAGGHPVFVIQRHDARRL